MKKPRFSLQAQRHTLLIDALAKTAASTSVYAASGLD